MPINTTVGTGKNKKREKAGLKTGNECPKIGKRVTALA
jgi:hypothetical protein